MIWFAFIHPVWQITALVLGVRNLAIGFSRAKTWTFPTQKHRLLGLLFIILSFTGSIIGWQVNAALAKSNQALILSGHRFIAYLVIGLMILIAVSGFLRQSRSHRLRWLQALHGWFGVLVTGLVFAQLFIVLAKLIGW